MTELWRLSAFPALDGAGGLRASGRWNPKGRAVIYTAASPPGTLIEALVHLDLRPEELPNGYRLLGIEVPDAVVAAAFKPTLADGWQAHMEVTRELGRKWLDGGTSLLCRVPSAIMPRTWNYLANPKHPDMARVKPSWDEPFVFDERLFGPNARVRLQ